LTPNLVKPIIPLLSIQFTEKQLKAHSYLAKKNKHHNSIALGENKVALASKKKKC
jgi:hypothetical protein